MHALASSVALAIVLAAAAPPAAPAPTPFPIGTLQPFAPGPPAPFASPLPEIGRVRSTTPACAIVRDLIIPSIEAGRRADVRFAQTRTRLPQYVDIAEDPDHADDVYRRSALAKLDNDASALLEEALVLNRALGDPRLAKPTDPQVIAERAALQQLYDAHKTRAFMLWEFVMRQRNATATSGIGPSPFEVQDSTPRPDPAMTAPPGMPLLNGSMSLADKRAMNEWSSNISAYVHAGELASVKVLVPIAQSCR
jgi:hypothetical protein